MLKFTLKIFLLFALSQTLFPQGIEKGDINFKRWLFNYPAHFIKGFEYSFLSEDRPIWLLSSSIVALTLSKFDYDISQKFLDKPFLSDDLSKFGDNYGKTFGWGYFAGIGFITIESVLYKNKFSDYFYKLEIVLESIVLTQLITQTLKLTTFRERPNRSDNHSFPSGHTSSTFALASSLNGIYGLGVGLPAYAFATLVGLQRISSSAHYLSDVFVGAILGTFVGESFTFLHKDKTKKNKSVNIIPYFDQNNLTYNLRIHLNL